MWAPGQERAPQSLWVTGQDILPLAGEGSRVLPASEAPAEKSSGSSWDAAVGLTPAVGGRLRDRWALSAVPLRARLTEQGQLLLLDCGVWTRWTLQWEGPQVTACAPHAPASGLDLCSVSKDTELLVVRPLGGPGLDGAERATGSHGASLGWAPGPPK